MDRVRNKNPQYLSNKKIQGAIAVTVLLLVIIYIVNIDFSSKRIDRDTLLIGEVVRGELEIKVSANGILLPEKEEWLVSQVEGRVVKLHAKPGDSVKKGQLLMELDNPVLIAAAEEAYSVWEGKRAEKTSFEVELEKQLLTQKSVTLQAKFAYEKAKLKLVAETQLIEKEIISKIDYQKTLLDVEQLKEVSLLEEERLTKTKANMAIELSAKEALVTQMKKSLERANNRVSALKVMSGIDGVVQELDLEIGQRLAPGSKIGRLAQQDVLYAELKVQARQAGNITAGQKAVVDTRNGKVEGLVSRVNPAVNEGTVIVDVALTGQLPKGARPELQVEGIIYVAQIKDTLFVEKPSLVKTNSVVSLYRLDSDEVYAQRVNSHLGQASVNRIQIIDGLQEGDKIILSDTSGWQDHPVIMLN